MTQNPNLAALSSAGVSVWLDDLSRQRLQSGNLQELIDTMSIVGVTTNPSIFQKALAEGDAYDAQIAELAERGADVDATIRTATTDDVRNAADVLRPQWEASDGVDGRVSIEVDPRLAHDTDKTVAQAVELWKIVDRPNVFIKIPATKAGLPAISAVLAEGISVNVTLIFSVERHREVIDAYLDGLQQAKAAGHDLSKIHSVASFFVSRVDTEIDKRLEKIGPEVALELRGQAGVANARLAYAAYQEVFDNGDRFQALKADGARVQRPLWASTGVKDPVYSDTMYVTELVAPYTVNTMPEKTMDAVADHGVVTGDVISGTASASQAVFDKLEAAGIDLTDVFVVLEDEGVEKFIDSWSQLLSETQKQLGSADKSALRTPRAPAPTSGTIRCGTSGISDCPESPALVPWCFSASLVTWPAKRLCRRSTTWPTAGYYRPPSPWWASPAATGITKGSRKRSTTASKHTAVPRFARRTGNGWPTGCGSCRARSTTKPGSAGWPRPWTSWMPSAASAETTPSTWRSRPSRSRWCANSCTNPGSPISETAAGAGWSSRNPSATTSKARATSTMW